MLDNPDSANDLITETGQWYNYCVEISPFNSQNRIKAWFWEEGEGKEMPNTPGIDEVDNNLVNGSIGVVSHSGTGSRFWGDIRVLSTDYPGGTNIVSESFIRDTVVDVKPYVPANWHPDYTKLAYGIEIDTTGFVLDTTGCKLDTSGIYPALVYRHKQGVEYPVTCRLIPETNLSWRNYEFSGTIIKPEGDVYDSVEIGAIFYAEDENNFYKLVARGKQNGGNQFVVINGDSVMENSIGSVLFEGDVDTVHFAVQVETDNYSVGDTTTIIDGRIDISVRVWEEGESIPQWKKIDADISEKRNKYGNSGIILDDNNKGSKIDGIEIKSVNISKLE